MGRAQVGPGGTRGTIPVGLALTLSLTLALVLSLGLSLGLAAGDAGASKSSTSAALAHAKKQLLKLSDMPKGWTSSKSEDVGGSFPGQNELATCIGVPPSTIKLNPPSTNSPEFSNKDQTETVDDSIDVFTSTKVAKSQYDAMTNPKTPACFAQILNGIDKQQLTSSFGSGATVGTITVTRPSSPRKTSALELGFTVVSQGVSVPVKLLEIFALEGTEGLDVGFSSIGTSFPTSLSKHLTTVALDRA
jgi:hypothetical protein